MTTTDITPDINSWTGRDGKERRYINNWQRLAGIHVDHYKTGNVSGVWIENYDGSVSNRKGASTAAGKVWLDADNNLHLDYHSGDSLLSEDEKRDRIVAALTAAGIL